MVPGGDRFYLGININGNTVMDGKLVLKILKSSKMKNENDLQDNSVWNFIISSLIL